MGKLPLAFLAFKEGQDIRQKAPGNGLYLILRDVGAVDRFLPSSQMYLRNSENASSLLSLGPMVGFLLFPQFFSHFWGNAVHEPPQLLIFLFQHEQLQLLLAAVVLLDLASETDVLLGQILDGGLILLHLAQMLFQLGEVRLHHLQQFVPLLPRIQHPDLRNDLFNGLLLFGKVGRLFEQLCGDVLSLGDQGAFTPLQDWERLVHVSVELVLPAGELHPIPQNLLG